MKQHISVSQLKQLSDTEIKFLALYNGHIEYDSYAMWQYVANETTVGNIISFLYRLGAREFVYDENVFVGVYIDCDKWVVYNISGETMAEDEELVDALWYAFIKALRQAYDIEGKEG